MIRRNAILDIMSSSSSPPKRPRRHSQNEFLSLMISAKRLPSSSYHQITELNLSNLQLIQIETFPFEFLPKLLSLDLSFNQLNTINLDWSKSKENFIEILNISHNRLETLLFLKDFKHLKSLNVTNNFLRNTERFLSLSLCSTLEHLIDANVDQFEDDQLKLDQWLQIMDSKITRLWSMSYHDKYQQELIHDKNQQIVKKLLDDFRHATMKIFEKQTQFSQMHLSPLANHLINQKIEQFSVSKPSSRSTLKTHLTEDFTQLMESKPSFELVKLLRCHQTSEQDLQTIAIRMSAFEPNTSKNILATCAGQKVCFTDCDTGEVTHLYEVAALRSTKKLKDKTPVTEHFSCLCWIEIPMEDETCKVLAVGATNGHIYLLSYVHKLMFGHIELPNASISCLIWHANEPSTLIIGSYHTVRFYNIQSYLDRFRSFAGKQKSKSSSQFDYVESSNTNKKSSSSQVYNFDNGDDTILHITDLLFYPISDDSNQFSLLVGTTSGLFLIHNQTPTKLTFPKSFWTVGESIESLRLIEQPRRLLAMNILGLDQIACFDLIDQQLHLMISLPNPYRQIATKMAVCSTNNENTGASFECVIGSDQGSFFYHQIRLHSNNNKKSKKLSFDTKRHEIPWPQMKPSNIPSLLSASLNEQYLCLTTTNNLICIYKRQ